MYGDLGGNGPSPNLSVRNTMLPSIYPVVRLPMEITHEKSMVIQRINAAGEAQGGQENPVP